MHSVQPEQNVTKRRGLRRISLTQWIVIAAILGIVIGILFPTFAVASDHPNASSISAAPTTPGLLWLHN